MRIPTRLCIIWVAFACIVLSACSKMAPTIMPVQVPGSSITPVRLYGIRTEPPYDRGATPLRILLIHGMGTGLYPPDGPCALSSVIEGLANSLRMSVQSTVVRRDDTMCGPLVVPEPRFIKVQNTPLEAKFYTYRFHDATDTHKMQVSFLLWAPLTYDLKMTPIMSERGHPPWAWLTQFSKSFIQTHLGDVVLYGGTYRVAIRAAVEQAMCYFINGSPDITGHHCTGGHKDARSVIITHSLGGYMLMDAIADLKAAHMGETPDDAGGKTSDNAAAIMLSRTDLVFMLANQLALLDLTTQSPDLLPQPGPRTVTDGRELEMHGALGAFMDYWRALRRRADKTAPRQIVAISDPNDLLSYRLSPNEIDVADDTIVANVYLGVAWNFANLGAWPVSAHLNYLTDPTVMKIMVCGMTGDTVVPCSP